MTALIELRPRVRPILKIWHRWFGMFAGLWLLMLAVTGCAITFYDELDTWLNPDWRSVPAATSGTAAPLQTAIEKAESVLPGFVPNSIELPGHDGDTLWMLGRAPVEGTEKSVQLFANPQNGEVLGWRVSGQPALDRRHLVDLLYSLHIDLLAGPWMAWFFGLISFLWLLDHVAALSLSFPKAAQWLRSFRVDGRRGSLKRLYDLHRAPGLWLTPITITLALTGVTLTWPAVSRDVAGVVSPVSSRLHDTMEEAPPPATAIGIDAAMLRVDEPGAVHSVRFLPDEGVYAVRTFDPRDRDDQGRLWTYVSMADGAIVGSRHDNGVSAADEFFAWQYPLHSGKAFGLPGRIAIFISGLITALLCITGIKLWLRRRPFTKR